MASVGGGGGGGGALYLMYSLILNSNRKTKPTVHPWDISGQDVNKKCQGEPQPRKKPFRVYLKNPKPRLLWVT